MTFELVSSLAMFWFMNLNIVFSSPSLLFWKFSSDRAQNDADFTPFSYPHFMNSSVFLKPAR